MSLIFRLNIHQLLRCQLQKPTKSFQQICTTPKRTSLNNRLRRIGSSVEKELALKKSDGIQTDYELIYRATIGSYLNAAKYCVIFSTAAVVGLAASQIFSEGNFIPTPVPELIYGGLIAEDDDIKYFACGFIVINLVFSAILRRYPLRIYKKVDKYIAVYESSLPFRGVQHHHFNKGQVFETEPLIDAWKDCYFRLGSRNSLMFSYYFRTPSEFNQMF